MDEDSLGPILEVRAAPNPGTQVLGYNKSELSPSLQWGSEVIFPEGGLAGGDCGCSWHSYSLITQFAFSFTGRSGLARVTRSPREARASGKLLFLICPPGCSFGILRLVPCTYFTDHGWGDTHSQDFRLPSSRPGVE